MIRRYKLGSDVELHKRTLEMGELSLIGPEARRVAGAGALGPAEHDNARADDRRARGRRRAHRRRRRRLLRRRGDARRVRARCSRPARSR